MKVETDQTPAPQSDLATLERDIEARSAVFKKELGLFDLILVVVVANAIGAAIFLTGRRKAVVPEL